MCVFYSSNGLKPSPTALDGNRKLSSLFPSQIMSNISELWLTSCWKQKNPPTIAGNKSLFIFKYMMRICTLKWHMWIFTSVIWLHLYMILKQMPGLVRGMWDPPGSVLLLDLQNSRRRCEVMFVPYAFSSEHPQLLQFCYSCLPSQLLLVVHPCSMSCDGGDKLVTSSVFITNFDLYSVMFTVCSLLQPLNPQLRSFFTLEMKKN